VSLGHLIVAIGHVIDGFVGVVIGFGLAKWDQWRRGEWEADAVRRLLRAGIGDNRQEEALFWSRATGNMSLEQWRGYPRIIRRWSDPAAPPVRTPWRSLG